MEGGVIFRAYVLQTNLFLRDFCVFWFFFQISDSDLLYWRELVSKCLADYSSPECCKPDHKKLVWIVSRRTAQNLQNSYYSVPELPTIPEGGCFNGSERLVTLGRCIYWEFSSSCSGHCSFVELWLNHCCLGRKSVSSENIHGLGMSSACGKKGELLLWCSEGLGRVWGGTVGFKAGRLAKVFSLLENSCLVSGTLASRSVACCWHQEICALLGFQL